MRAAGFKVFKASKQLVGTKAEREVGQIARDYEPREDEEGGGGELE